MELMPAIADAGVAGLVVTGVGLACVDDELFFGLSGEPPMIRGGGSALLRLRVGWVMVG
jgi:hypothetical protein